MKGWLWVQMRQLVRKGLWISGPAVTETPRTLHPGLWQVLSVSVQQVCRLFYYLSLILHPQVTLHHVMLPGIHFGPWAAAVPLSSWSLRWKPCPEAALSTSIPVPNWPKSKENLSDNSCMDFQGKAVYSKVVTQKEKNQSESHREEAECSPLGDVLHLAVCLFETWPRVPSEPGVLGPPGGARAWGRAGWGGVPSPSWNSEGIGNVAGACLFSSWPWLWHQGQHCPLQGQRLESSTLHLCHPF